MDVKVRRVVGGVIFNSKKEIFLGESPKWQGWVISAGGVERGETDEEAYVSVNDPLLDIQT